jgi:hypothetical protein
MKHATLPGTIVMPNSIRQCSKPPHAELRRISATRFFFDVSISTSLNAELMRAHRRAVHG